MNIGALLNGIFVAMNVALMMLQLKLNSPGIACMNAFTAGFCSMALLASVIK